MAGINLFLTPESCEAAVSVWLSNQPRIDSSTTVNQDKLFLHMGQGFPHQLPVLENVILQSPM